MTLQKVGDPCTLCTSAFADLAPSFYIFHFVIIPLTVDYGILYVERGNFTTGFVAQVASYHSTMLEFTELLRVTHSFTNVCRNSLHA